LEHRELNQARSKPNTVDRPVRTARIFVTETKKDDTKKLHAFEMKKMTLSFQKKNSWTDHKTNEVLMWYKLRTEVCCKTSENDKK